MKDLILFGVQGSGKGTQARILVEQHGYKGFDTGSELRSIAAQTSELGKKVKGIIEAGKLVPDSVVIEIVEDFLKRTPKSQAVIFDGLPRRLTQKDLFEAVMNKFGRSPTAVLISIPDELALKRLTNRWMSKSGKIYPSRDLALIENPEETIYQRADDKEEAIKVRLKTYHEETKPVIEWYKSQGRMVEVNGEREAEKVTGALMEKIKN